MPRLGMLAFARKKSSYGTMQPIQPIITYKSQARRLPDAEDEQLLNNGSQACADAIYGAQFSRRIAISRHSKDMMFQC
ncbi:hypothetical protein BCR34DRAFT_600682 [Clohesyomyces aquaticus]|uniref:Uncharacterized protein n=1 Tax=Clohesyomyces aquaticus TaxID=1231657 RepID=A0A1Y1ZPY3_9PLEO|nr:hypothetical protein BCR34DRAFT_600682 [Clohesyomyces aquaticus]